MVAGLFGKKAREINLESREREANHWRTSVYTEFKPTMTSSRTKMRMRSCSLVQLLMIVDGEESGSLSGKFCKSRLEGASDFSGRRSELGEIDRTWVFCRNLRQISDTIQ